MHLWKLLQHMGMYLLILLFLTIKLKKSKCSKNNKKVSLHPDLIFILYIFYTFKVGFIFFKQMLWFYNPQKHNYKLIETVLTFCNGYKTPMIISTLCHLLFDLYMIQHWNQPITDIILCSNHCTYCNICFYFSTTSIESIVMSCNGLSWGPTLVAAISSNVASPSINWPNTVCFWSNQGVPPFSP